MEGLVCFANVENGELNLSANVSSTLLGRWPNLAVTFSYCFGIEISFAIPISIYQNFSSVCQFDTRINSHSRNMESGSST